VEWRERYERAAGRYESGETREADERQLVQLANAAWAAGLSLLMAGDRKAAGEWLRRAAARYRESWDAGASSEAWGRPIGAMKALLIAEDDAAGAARWALDAGAAEAESPIGRYAGVLAQLVLGRDDEAAALANTLGEGFPSDVTQALRALAARDAEAYRIAVDAVRHSFETREAFLEDLPAPDTALALDALAERRGLVLSPRAEAQLAALADVVAQLDAESIDHWLFGGWAVDFHVGRVTRRHTDVDLAVPLDDVPRVRALLERGGWRHAPDPEEDGGTSFEREAVRLELTYLVRLDDGTLATPLRDGPVAWAADALADDVCELGGVRSRVISRPALVRGKSTPRTNPDEAERDRADHEALRRADAG